MLKERWPENPMPAMHRVFAAVKITGEGPRQYRAR